MQRLKFLLVMFFAVLDQATGTSFLTNENVENSTFSNTPTENLRTLLKGILLKLNEKSGSGIHKLPEVELSQDSFMVGSFISSKNVIRVEMKAINECRSLGKDSINALAFLIAHEYVHFLKHNKHKKSTNFLSYEKGDKANLLEEQEADVYGLFLSYLAGYNNRDVTEDILTRLYNAYKIRDKVLINYPSFETRILSNKEVLTKVEQLIHIFKTGNYLLALGEFSYAKYCFNFVNSIHSSYEIHNNIGVLNMLESIENFKLVPRDQYFMPIMIENKSTLDLKKRQGRGEDTLSLHSDEYRMRIKGLGESITWFEKAIKQQKNYFPAYMNKICALYYLGNKEKTVQFINLTKSKFSKSQNIYLLDMILLVNDNSLAISDKISKFKELVSMSEASSTSIFAKNIIKANFSLISGEKLNELTFDYELPEELSIMMRKLSLEKLTPKSSISLSNKDRIQFIYNVKGNSVNSAIIEDGVKKYTFKYYPPEIIPDIKLGEELDLNIFNYKNFIATSDGFIYHQNRDQYLVCVNNNGSISSMVKYFK